MAFLCKEDKFFWVKNLPSTEQISPGFYIPQSIHRKIKKSYVPFGSNVQKDSKQKYDYIIKRKLKERKKYSIIIVGNKCDLENERKVSKEEAESYGKNIGVMTIETSALNGINVNEAFLKVIEIHLDKMGNKNGKGKGCPCF